MCVAGGLLSPVSGAIKLSSFWRPLTLSIIVSIWVVENGPAWVAVKSRFRRLKML